MIVPLAAQSLCRLLVCPSHRSHGAVKRSREQELIQEEEEEEEAPVAALPPSGNLSPRDDVIGGVKTIVNILNSF